MADDMTGDGLADKAAPADGVRRASVNERNGRAALFAAAFCVIGMLVLLVGQLGWWTLVAGPAYLAAVAMTTMLARGRGRALIAVVLATGSMLILVALVKLTGLL